jgi:hypothetical protein
MVREEIKPRVERLGAPLIVAAELHNPDLQLSLIAGNVGVGCYEPVFCGLTLCALDSALLSIRISIFQSGLLFFAPGILAHESG